MGALGHSPGLAVLHPGHRDRLARRDPPEEVDLATGQRPELAGGQTLGRDRPDRDPGQGHHLVAELGEHPPNLAVLALGQDQFQDRRLAPLADRPDPLGPDLAFGQPDPVGELRQDLASGRAGDGHPVKLLDAELGVGQLVGQFAIVGQEHQADAHLVEPPDGVDALGDLGQEVEDPGPARGVVVGRDVSLGLVDREVDRPLQMDLLAVHRHGLAGGVDFGPEFLDDLATDRHPPLEDQFLARPTGTDAGMGEDLLEPLRPRGFPRPTRGSLRGRPASRGGRRGATPLGWTGDGATPCGRATGPPRGRTLAMRRAARLRLRAVRRVVPPARGTLRSHGPSDLDSAFRIPGARRPWAAAGAVLPSSYPAGRHPVQDRTDDWR